MSANVLLALKRKVGFYISGSENTRSFFKMTNQLPRILQALDGFITNRLRVLFGQALPFALPSNPVLEGGKEELLIPLVEQSCNPLGCKTVASW